MNKFYGALSFLAVFPFIMTACAIQALPIQTEEQDVPKSASYEILLGKSITDDAVRYFITDNNCSPADSFQLCKEIGMAWWISSDQVVRTIYLYAGSHEGFKRYQGELPFGLTFYDPMWRVQEKLRNQNTDDSFDQTGLPDEASSPDHIHYWAVYKRLGMTIIYNAPFADEDAYIYAILVSK